MIKIIKKEFGLGPYGRLLSEFDVKTIQYFASRLHGLHLDLFLNEMFFRCK